MKFFQDKYHKFFMTRPPGVLASETSLIEKFVAAPSGGKLFDLGCGCGEFAGALSAKGYKVTGIDASEPYIEQARREVKGAEFILGKFEDIRFIDTFDGAFCWYTSFGFATRLHDTILFHRAYDSLVEGGRLVLEFPNTIHVLMNFEPVRVYDIDGTHIERRSEVSANATQMLQEWEFSDGNEKETIKTTFNLYTPADIRAVLQETGFSHVEVLSRNGAPVPRRTSEMW